VAVVAYPRVAFAPHLRPRQLTVQSNLVKLQNLFPSQLKNRKVEKLIEFIF
jgi:hypothetical protein